MFGLGPAVRVYLAAASADMFVFANRRRDRIKVPYRDRVGFAIWAKELGVDPIAHLKDVLSRVGAHPNSRIDELPPDRSRPARASGPTGAPGQTG